MSILNLLSQLHSNPLFLPPLPRHILVPTKLNLLSPPLQPSNHLINHPNHMRRPRRIWMQNQWEDEIAFPLFSLFLIVLVVKELDAWFPHREDRGSRNEAVGVARCRKVLHWCYWGLISMLKVKLVMGKEWWEFRETDCLSCTNYTTTQRAPSPSVVRAWEALSSTSSLRREVRNRLLKSAA